ncbi:MipA/OmpV family protein [Pseudoalteromonas piscicida]|uniref:MipA/OmpV family protein n=1 Tax=Pseudoalteromonas piscicida TaxID=43662 RepID=UPI003C7DBB55
MNKYLLCVCTLFSAHGMSQSLNAESEMYVGVDTYEASLIIGYGGIESPLVGAKHFSSVLLPHFAYYGDRWYFDDFSLGYSLYQDKSIYIDLVTTFNEDGFFFELDGVDKLFTTSAIRDTSRPNRPRPLEQATVKRSLSYEGGIAFGYAAKDWGVEFTTLHDISGVHNSFENKLIAYHVQSLYAGVLTLETGATYKSRDLITYYYRLPPHETVTKAPLNLPNEHAINYHIKLEYQYPISQRYHVTFGISNTWIDNDLSDTAMFDRSRYISGFTGILIKF